MTDAIVRRAAVGTVGAPAARIASASPGTS